MERGRAAAEDYDVVRLVIMLSARNPLGIGIRRMNQLSRDERPLIKEGSEKDEREKEVEVRRMIVVCFIFHHGNLIREL